MKYFIILVSFLVFSCEGSVLGPGPDLPPVDASAAVNDANTADTSVVDADVSHDCDCQCYNDCDDDVCDCDDCKCDGDDDNGCDHYKSKKSKKSKRNGK